MYFIKYNEQNLVAIALLSLLVVAYVKSGRYNSVESSLEDIQKLRSQSLSGNEETDINGSGSESSPAETDSPTETTTTEPDTESTTEPETTEPDTESTTDSPAETTTTDTDTDSPAETTTTEPETDSSDDSEDPKTDDPTSPVEKECSENEIGDDVFMYNPESHEFYYTHSITVKSVEWDVKIRFTTSECSETTPDEETGSDVTTDEATIEFKDKLLCVTESSIQEARRINEYIKVDGCFKIDALTEKLSEEDKTKIEEVITSKAGLVDKCGESTKDSDCGKVDAEDIYDVDMSGMILPSLLSLLTLILLL